MIALRYSNLRSDREAPQHSADVLIGVTADLELVTDVGVIYAEPDFPVVELAAELGRWLATGAPAQQDFEFDSMETEERGWVWIRRVEGGWRIGSLHQDRADPQSRDFEELRGAVGAFIETVDRDLSAKWGLDLGEYTVMGE